MIVKQTAYEKTVYTDNMELLVLTFAWVAGESPA